MFATPAYAQAAGGAAGAGPEALLMQFLPLVALVVLFYFLMIRPQQRRMKQHQAMIAAVKVRDTIVTTGGLIGKVTKVDEHEIELEIAANTRVRVVKSMLSEVRPHGTKAAND